MYKDGGGAHPRCVIGRRLRSLYLTSRASPLAGSWKGEPNSRLALTGRLPRSCSFFFFHLPPSFARENVIPYFLNGRLYAGCHANVTCIKVVILPRPGLSLRGAESCPKANRPTNRGRVSPIFFFHLTFRIFYNPGRQLDPVVVILLNGKIRE